MSPFDVFFSAPPISRAIAASVFTFSLVLYLNVISFSLFNLSLESLIKFPPELWRLFTSLLITGPDFGILLDTYFLYAYGAKLEIGSARFSQRADFFTYICFVSIVILLLNILVTGGSVLASALSFAFILNSTRESWDEPMTFIVVKMPSQYFPYMYLLLSLIIRGSQTAIVQATGLAAAHLYDVLGGQYPDSGIKRNLISTPGWVKRMLGTQSVLERPYGTVFMPANRAGSTGGAAWGLDLSWKRFGEGRRLGGEGESNLASQRPKGWVLAVMGLAAFVAIFGLLAFLFFWNGTLDG